MTYGRLTKEHRLALAIRAEVTEAQARRARERAERLTQAIGPESTPDAIAAASSAQRAAAEARALGAAAMAELGRFGGPSHHRSLQEWIGVSVEEFDDAFLAALREAAP
jgi:hypothetical protein